MEDGNSGSEEDSALIPSLAIGTPHMGPTLRHREPMDLAWRCGKRERERSESNKVLRLVSIRGLRSVNGGILTLSLGVWWQSWLCWWSGTQALRCTPQSFALVWKEKVCGYTGWVLYSKVHSWLSGIGQANDLLPSWDAQFTLMHHRNRLVRLQVEWLVEFNVSIWQRS